MMPMVEDGNADTTERKLLNTRQWLFVRTSVGEVFSIVQPDVSDELLAKMMEMARELLRDDANNLVA